MPRTFSVADRRRFAPWFAIVLLVAGIFLGSSSSNLALAQTVDCATLAAGSGNGTAGTQTASSAGGGNAVYDYVFLIDISRSMGGAGGSPNIFPEVKAAIVGYLNSLPTGVNIRIMPFAGQINPSNVLAITLNGDADRKTAVDHVDGLIPNGQGTWIYEAVGQALAALKQMQGNDPNPHIQSLLLYTDGQGNGPNDRPVSTLVDRLKVARADQPYLYVKYIALGADVPGEQDLKNGGVDVVKVPQGMAPSPVREVGIAPATLDLGAVNAGQSASAARQLCTTSRVGNASGEKLTVSVDGQNLPNGVQIKVDPGALTVGATANNLQLTIAAGANVAPGTYHAQLSVKPATASDVVLAPSTVGLTFEVRPGVPPTPTPSPTPSPTPTPTATPTPGVSFGQSFPLDLGRQRISLKSTDGGTVTFSGQLNGDFAGGAALAVKLDALDASNPLPLQIPNDVFLRSGDVGSLTDVKLEAGSGSVQIVANVDRAKARALGEGTYVFRGQLRANAGQAAFLPKGAVQQPDGSVLLPFAFTVEVYKPFDPVPWLIGAGIGLAGLLVLGLVWSSFPRLPAGSALLTLDGHVEPLRDAQRSRLFGRLFGGSLSIGGNGSDVNLGLDGIAGVARGTWFWRKRTVFAPRRDDIRIDGETLEEGKPRRLETSEQLRIDRQTYTYVERRQTGRTSREDDEGYAATTGVSYDDDDTSPRRARFARRSRAYDEDDDYD